VGSKTLLRQNPPVLNWGCQLMRVVPYDDHRVVAVVVVLYVKDDDEIDNSPIQDVLWWHLVVYGVLTDAYYMDPLEKVNRIVRERELSVQGIYTWLPGFLVRCLFLFVISCHSVYEYCSWKNYNCISYATHCLLLQWNQIGFTFLVPAHPGCLGQRAVKQVCVCVFVCIVLVVSW